MDVDLTVEEGIRAVVTSGVVIRNPDVDVDVGRLAVLNEVDSVDPVDDSGRNGGSDDPD